jgi:hypothetical protein
LKLVVRQMDTAYPVLRIRGVFVPKNRVLHARITDDTHEKLTRVCSELDCSITDYVTSVLDESFDQEPRNIEPEPTPKIIVKRISYDDGKTWIDVPEV